MTGIDIVNNKMKIYLEQLNLDCITALKLFNTRHDVCIQHLDWNYFICIKPFENNIPCIDTDTFIDIGVNIKNRLIKVTNDFYIEPFDDNISIRNIMSDDWAILAFTLKDIKTKLHYRNSPIIKSKS